MVCMDGVNSMTGNAPDLRAFARVAREHDALLYVDDAHGFGVIGERGADETCAYGKRGNSIVRHFGETYDDIVLVAGFSKAYSSLVAFIACPTELKDLLKIAAPPYLYSGPSPVASLRDRARRPRRQRGARRPAAPRLWPPHRSACSSGWPGSASTRPTTRASRSSRCRSRGTSRSARSAASCSTAASTSRSPHTRWCRKHEVGFRVQVTAANTDAEIERLNRTCWPSWPTASAALQQAGEPEAA